MNVTTSVGGFGTRQDMGLRISGSIIKVGIIGALDAGNSGLLVEE